MLRQRFHLLNNAIKNLQNDVTSISKELLAMSQHRALTVHQQLEKIKSAHDKYIAMYELINKLLHVIILMQICSNTGVVTAKLYALISMIMDQQYDSHIFIHCVVWVTYRMYNILIFVFVVTLTANEVSLIYQQQQ